MSTQEIINYSYKTLQPHAGDYSKSIHLHYSLPASVNYKAGTVVGLVYGTNEVQTLTEGTAITAGTYTITFDGQTTTAIAYNATAATVQAALEALSTIGVGNIKVTGGSVDTAPLSLEFIGKLAAKNVSQVTVGTGSLTGTITVATATPGAPATVAGQVKEYSASATDGSQNPIGMLIYDCTTDANRNITYSATNGQVGGDIQESRGSTPVLLGGGDLIFKCEDIANIQSALVTAGFFKIVAGTLASGLVKL